MGLRRLGKGLYVSFLSTSIVPLFEMRAFAAPAFALTEEGVQAQVDSAGQEQRTGNVLIWFLCAIGFLKVSQKIDSFMSSLGINIGKTGGSMMAEAMIAARGVGMAVRGAGAISSHFGGGHGGHAAPAGEGGSSGGNGGGRISSTELNEENPQGIGFGMYNASQYMEPKGDFETVKASDGSKWYKQYAQDTVEKKLFRDGEGKVSYQENIVKRVPDPPKRKERV